MSPGVKKDVLKKEKRKTQIRVGGKSNAGANDGGSVHPNTGTEKNTKMREKKWRKKEKKKTEKK